MRNRTTLAVAVALIVLMSGCIGLSGNETTTNNPVETTVDTTTSQTTTQNTTNEPGSATTQPPTTQFPTTTQVQTTTEPVGDAEVSFNQKANGSQNDVTVTVTDMAGAEKVELAAPNGNMTIRYEGMHTLFGLSEGDTVEAYAVGSDGSRVLIHIYTVKSSNNSTTDNLERLPDPPTNPHPRPAR